MKKLLWMLSLALTMSVFGQYVVGDFVTNISWEDSDDGTIVSESIQNFVDNKKVLVASWGYLG